jgi:oligosaccharide repeat unit polymerase
LDYQFEGKLEGTPPGGNTFAPLYRLLSKLDVVEPVKEYEKFYFVPMGTNTGSYLRELYADWGLAGTLSIVYLLGAICSIVYEAYQRKRSLVLLATLAHLNVLVFFTFALQTTRWTYWLISLVASILAGTIVDRYSNNSSPSPQEVVSRF